MKKISLTAILLLFSLMFATALRAQKNVAYSVIPGWHTPVVSPYQVLYGRKKADSANNHSLRTTPIYYYNTHSSLYYLGFIRSNTTLGNTVATLAYDTTALIQAIPWEAWAISIDGTPYIARNVGHCQGSIGSFSAYHEEHSSRICEWKTVVDSVEITKTITLDTALLSCYVVVNFTNLSTAPRNNISYVQAFAHDREGTRTVAVNEINTIKFLPPDINTASMVRVVNAAVADTVWDEYADVVIFNIDRLAPVNSAANSMYFERFHSYANIAYDTTLDNLYNLLVPINTTINRQEITIYSNPENALLIMGLHKGDKITCLDMTGRAVGEELIADADQPQRYSLQGLPQGRYLLLVADDQGHIISRQKIEKQ